ncbi:MAG: trigger factor [Lachnospiraceae bacterium]|nr:trigger factor [Lachnospiraceae bacterium]
MKKKFWMMLMMAAVLALAGCGSNSSDSEAAEETETEEETTEDSSSDYVLYEDLTSTLVSLGEYKGIEMAKTVEEVPDEDVQSEIDSIKKEYSDLVDVDREAQTGDVVVIDFTGYIDGETSDSLQGTETSVEIGSGSFLEDFENGLIGVTADEDMEINMTFPENYSEEVAGKDVTFEIHVYRVSEYQIADWSDEFVQENLSYDSIADMEESIREELEATAEEEAESNWQYELVYALLENSEFEIEDADVEAYIDQMMSEYETYATMYGMELGDFLETYLGVTEEGLREMFRETAEFRVQMTLAFHEIAELEGMEVSDDEYQEYLQSIADAYGYEDASDIETYYSPDTIREQLIQEKVIDLICENAVDTAE